ncbi:MAG: response regulator [Pseudomonadota bacterium]
MSPNASDLGADRRRVVVVDDDPLFLSTLTLNLEDAGFDVTAFTASTAALDHLSAGAQPDAVILDWHMPEMDGLELLQRLRAQGPGRAGDLPDLAQPADLRGARARARRGRLRRKIAQLLDHPEAAAPDHRGRQAAGARLAGRAGTAPGAVARRPARAPRRQLPRAVARPEVPLTLTEFHVVALLADKAGGDVSLPRDLRRRARRGLHRRHRQRRLSQQRTHHGETHPAEIP